MNYIYLGKIVNTHGIKGEVRIISNFKYKNDVFKPNIKIYIGNSKEEVSINTYRVHKNFDMLTFKEIDNINDVLKYKGKNIYFNKDDINIDGVLDEELIGLDVYTDHYIGKVEEILTGPNQQVLVIKKDKITNMVPYIDEFIKNIDLDNKKIYINEIEGLINEN